jgi:Trypsin
VLQEAYLQLRYGDDCEPLKTHPATQVCAGTENVAGACLGDSGGPLLAFDSVTGAPVLWGLTSYGPQIGFGLPVCSRELPAVFSWVPAFVPWISQTISAPQPPGTQPGGQTSGSPPQPVVQPPRDAVAPVLKGVRLAKTRIRAGRRTTLSFRLSEAAAVTVTILKKNRSRLKPILKVPFAASAGTVKRGFAARRGSKSLKPGRYVLRVAAVDTAGNRSRVVSVAFRVLR